MSLPVGTILRVVCTLYDLDNDLFQNVFNAVIGGSGGPFDEDDIVDDMMDWVDTMYGNLTIEIEQNMDPGLSKVYFYDHVDDDWDEVGSGTPTFTTTDTAIKLPQGVAALINAKTIDPDVSGKKYIPGPTVLYWLGNTWHATYLTALAAFAVDWYTSFVGAGTGATFIPAIWSPTRGAAYVLSGVVDIPTIAAYQRRRKPGVGA